MMGNRSRKKMYRKRIGGEKFVAPMERIRLELERECLSLVISEGKGVLVLIVHS